MKIRIIKDNIKEITSTCGYILKNIRTGQLYASNEKTNSSVIITKEDENNFVEIEKPLENYISPVQLSILDAARNEKIMQSKQVLAAYIKDNPLLFDGKYYNVTIEKQYLFATKYLQSQLIGIPMEWNSTGDKYEIWSKDKCQRFIVETQEYINPLIEWQQELEISIKHCDSLEEVNMININTLRKES